MSDDFTEVEWVLFILAWLCIALYVVGVLIHVDSLVFSGLIGFILLWGTLGIVYELDL